MKTFLSIALALSSLCLFARDTNRYDRVERRPDGVTFSQRGGMGPSNYVTTAISYSDLFEDVRTNDTTYAADRFKEAVKKYAEKTSQDFDATKLENLSAFFDNLRTNKLASATHSFSNAVVTFSPPVPAQDFDAAKLTNNAAYFDNLRTNLVTSDTLSFSNAVVSFETKQDFDARLLTHQSDFFDDARTGKTASVTHSLSNAVVTFSPPVDPSSLDARLLSNKDLMFDDIRTNRSPSVSFSFSNAVESVVTHVTYGDSRIDADGSVWRYVTEYTPAHLSPLTLFDTVVTYPVNDFYNAFNLDDNLEFSKDDVPYYGTESYSVLSKGNPSYRYVLKPDGMIGSYYQYSLYLLTPGSSLLWHRRLGTEQDIVSTEAEETRSYEHGSLYDQWTWTIGRRQIPAKTESRWVCVGKMMVDSASNTNFMDRTAFFDALRTNAVPRATVAFSNAVASVTAPPPDFDATKLTNKDAFFDDLRTNREAVASAAFGSAVRSKQAPASEITDSTNAVISADGSVYRLVKIPEDTNEYFTVESVNITAANPTTSAMAKLNNLRQSVGQSLYLTNSTYYSPYYEDHGYSSSGRSLCGLAFYRQYGGANGRWITVNSYESTWGYTAISVDYPFPTLSDGDVLSVTNGCTYSTYQSSHGNLIVSYRYHFEVTPAYYSRQYVGRLVNDSDLSSSAVLTNAALKTVGGTSVTQSHIGKGAGSFTTISADTSIKKNNQDVVYSVTVGGTTSRGDVTIDLDTPITTKLNAYKELHWDPGLSVTWTNVYNNGHVYMVTVTNTNVSVAP